MKDELNPKYMLQLTDSQILIKLASGEIDAKQLAKDELDARGLDHKTAKYIGFKK